MDWRKSRAGGSHAEERGGRMIKGQVVEDGRGQRQRRVKAAAEGRGVHPVICRGCITKRILWHAMDHVLCAGPVVQSPS